MILTIYLFSLLMLLAGIMLLIKPALIFDCILKYKDTTSMYATAIIVRLILGYILIYTAGLSRFPLTIQIIGWIAVAAAVIFAVNGKKHFQLLLGWLEDGVKPWGRLGGIVALLFGFFLLYAYI